MEGLKNWNEEKNLKIFCFSNIELKEIWNCINNKEEKSGNISLTYEKEEKTINKLFARKENVCKMLSFYKNPVNLKIDQKEYKIYTVEQCRSILSQFNEDDYIVIVNEKNINTETINHEDIKDIQIKKFNTKKVNEGIGEYILRQKNELPSKETIIEIEKKNLSLYFDEICISPDKNCKCFSLLLEETRIEFINKINIFLDSEKIFYLILGTDGIGKTISLLYYTSSFFNNYRNLYLNLKLLFKYQSKKNKLKEIFFDELKRLFLTYSDSKNVQDNLIYEYQYLIKTIDENERNSQGIQYIWDLLSNFIAIYDRYLTGDVLIVLDQYKTDDIDNNFQNLNKLSDLINSKRLNNRYKLMILISINNYDTKNIFLENLTNICFTPIFNNNIIPLPKYRSNIDDNYEIISNNIFNKNLIPNNYEFDDIENYLNKEYQNFQENFSQCINSSSFAPNPIVSKLKLNTDYLNLTKKEYINEIINCKSLLKEDIDKNYLNCIEIFGYSMKYYSLLMSEINNTKNENNEDKNEFSKKIVRSFYEKMKNKIKYNLDSFYNSLFKNEENISDLIIKNIISLDNSIYEEKIYSLHNMKLLLNRYPTKYLNIYIAGIDSSFIPLDVKDISKYGFFFDYSNNFVRETIHKLYLNDNLIIYKSISLGGSGFGALFEDLVNKKLKL